MPTRPLSEAYEAWRRETREALAARIEPAISELVRRTVAEQGIEVEPADMPKFRLVTPEERAALGNPADEVRRRIGDRKVHLATNRALCLWAVGTVLALLSAFLAMPAVAQKDRPLRRPTSVFEERNWMMTGRFTNTATLCTSGCDYADLGEALTFIGTLTRTQARRAVLAIYPGQQTGATGANFTEATVSWPSWTSVQGYVSASANGSLYSPTIRVSGTSGNLMTFGQGVTFDDVTFLMGANVTAAAVLGNAPTGASTIYLRNVGFIGSSGDGFALDLLSVAGDTVLFCDGCFFQKLGAGTLTRHVVTAGTASVTLTGGRYVPGTSQAKLIETTSTSTLRAQGIRVDAGATVDLTNTGGTLTEAFSTYETSSGTIGHADTHAAQLYFAPQTPASAAAACVAGQFTADADFVYFCSATNTWTRAALATWP